MNDLEQIEAIIAKNLTITDQRLMDGVIGAVMDAVDAEREACAKLCLETEPYYGQMFARAIRERSKE
jgi:hypothetical protein